MGRRQRVNWKEWAESTYLNTLYVTIRRTERWIEYAEETLEQHRNRRSLGKNGKKLSRRKKAYFRRYLPRSRESVAYAKEVLERRRNDPSLPRDELLGQLIWGECWDNPVIPLLLLADPTLSELIAYDHRPQFVSSKEEMMALLLRGILMWHSLTAEMKKWQTWMDNSTLADWDMSPDPNLPEPPFDQLGKEEPLARELHARLKRICKQGEKQ